MRGTTLLLVPLLLAAGACNDSNSPAGDAGDEDVLNDGGDEDGPPVPGFEADPEPAGAALYASVDMTDPAAPVATIWAARLGPTFGIALHVGFDGALLAAHDPATAPCIGPDAGGEALYVAAAKTGDVILGAVRRGPAAGEVEIGDPVVVATIPLTAIVPGTTRIDLLDAQVRRADGSFVPTGEAGGTLTTGGTP